MNNRANYFRLGLFVLTAIVLAVLSRSESFSSSESPRNVFHVFY